MKCTQPKDIHLAVYPSGEARTVIDFKSLVNMLDLEKLTFLNACIAYRLMEEAAIKMEKTND